MSKLKWTIKRGMEVVYTGTLKNMVLYSGWAELGSYGKGQCENGIKVGKWEYYNVNNQPMLYEEYDEHGLRQGWSRQYHPNGQLEKEEFYKDDCVQGDVNVFWPNGNVHKWISHSREGRIIEVKSYSKEGNILKLHQIIEQYKLKRSLVTRLKLEYIYDSDGHLLVEHKFERGRVVEVNEANKQCI